MRSCRLIKVGSISVLLAIPWKLLTLLFLLASKQAEFEEQAKLKNQFRALDDDEVDFLDAIVSSEKAKEAAVKKETAEELESFRKQQQQAEKASTAEEQTRPDVPAGDAWRTKKRRRKEADIPISKVRKTTTGSNTSPPPAAPASSPPKAASTPREEPVMKQPATGLGLAYASDSDDD